MTLRLSAVFFLMLIVLPTAAFTQQDIKTSEPSQGQAQTFDEVALGESENLWFESLQKTPDIVIFQKPGKGQTENKTEQWRFHILELRDKAKSNRAWCEYWKQQADLAEKLMASYSSAITSLQAVEGEAARVAMYENRKAAAQKWAALAKDKMENQDLYLRAIDIEKDAFEGRLDTAARVAAVSDADRTKPDESGETAKSEEEPNPYQKHKMLLKALEKQRNDQIAKMHEAQSDGELTEKLIEAGAHLLKAQQADLDLAKRERGIVEELIGLFKKDYSWRQRWKSVAEATDDKLEKLSLVLEGQKDAVTQLKAERSYYEALVNIKQDRATALDEQIDLEKTNVFKAVALTVKEVVLHRGLIVLGYLLGAYIAVLIVRRASVYIRKRADDGNEETRTDMEQRAETLVGVFSGVARFAVYFITGLLILKSLGVNIAPLMGAFAIFGLAISFGSQNLVKDLVTGLFILLEHQLSIDDVVTVGGITGVVESISLRRLVMRDVNGTLHTIPNSQVDVVSNLTHGWARAVVNVGVSYNDDLRKVKEVFNEVGRVMYEDPEWRPHLMEAPGFVGVTELGDSAVVVRVWVKTVPHQQWGVQRELNLRLKLAADENGIEIPFPQTVITMAKEAEAETGGEGKGLPVTINKE